MEWHAIEDCLPDVHLTREICERVEHNSATMNRPMFAAKRFAAGNTHGAEYHMST